MTPYAANLLRRELMLPAVVPRRSAMSFDVSPFEEPRSISIMRSGKLVFISPSGRGALIREINPPQSRTDDCESWGFLASRLHLTHTAQFFRQVTRRRQQPAGPHRQTTAGLEKAWAQSQQEELARVRQLRAALPNASPQALDALV